MILNESILDSQDSELTQPYEGWSMEGGNWKGKEERREEDFYINTKVPKEGRYVVSFTGFTGVRGRRYLQRCSVYKKYLEEVACKLTGMLRSCTGVTLKHGSQPKVARSHMFKILYHH